MDCVANADNTQCVNCGWLWLHPEISLWPNRNCDNPPSLRHIADELDLPDPLPAGVTQCLAAWIIGGKPERTAEERAALCKVCDRCWNRPKCWADEAIGRASLRCATWPCSIHSWERGGHGCGDELHRLIVRLTQQEVTHDCGCGDWITTMNHWTAAENREHIDETAAKMQQEADNRGWLIKIIARFPLAPTGTKWLIQWAIRQAEKWERRHGSAYRQ